MVSQEIKKAKKQYNKEKDNLVMSYSDELKRRDKHISILSESVHHQEIENKHLAEIIYTKDKEIISLQKHIDGLLEHLKYTQSLVKQSNIYLIQK